MQTELTDHYQANTATHSHTDPPLYDAVYCNLEDRTEQLPDDTWCLAVIRDTDRVHRIREFTDRIVQSLAPPPTITDNLRQTTESINLRNADLTIADAHNKAWNAIHFKKHYRDYLQCHAVDTQQSECTCLVDSTENTRAQSTLQTICETLQHRPVLLIDLTANNRNTPRSVLRDFIISEYEM